MKRPAHWLVVLSFITVACTFGFAPSAFADGTVYAMTNQLTSSGSNNILVYHRASNGTLSLIQTIATTGGGSGTQLDPTDSLGSQGSIILDEDHGRLFAVNTESAAKDSGADPDFPGTEVGDCNEGTISSFNVAANGTLTFVQKISSGGLFPDSLTIHGHLLYVLNAGGPGACGISPNTSGFTLRGAKMTPLSGSTQPISAGAPPFGFLNCDNSTGPFATAEFQCGNNPPAFPRSPAEVKFTPNGKQLVVTDKGPIRFTSSRSSMMGHLGCQPSPRLRVQTNPPTSDLPSTGKVTSLSPSLSAQPRLSQPRRLARSRRSPSRTTAPCRRSARVCPTLRAQAAGWCWQGRTPTSGIPRPATFRRIQSAAMAASPCWPNLPPW